MSPVEILGRYWVTNYAYAVEHEAAHPFLAITGHEADALGATDDYGTGPIENLAFLTGFLGYPCDAVYITAVLDIAGVAVLDHKDEIPSIEDILENPTTRTAVMAWTHSIPTRETALHLMIRTIEDDGTIAWMPVDPGSPTDPANGDLFTPLVHAAHDFDGYSPDDDEPKSRQLALDLVRGNNENTYVTEFFMPGTMLEKATEQAGGQ